MALRDYLEQRERELLSEIESLYLRVAQLRTDLIPLEGELAELRRAKSAIESGGGIGRPGIGGGIGGGIGTGLGGNSVNYSTLDTAAALLALGGPLRTPINIGGLDLPAVTLVPSLYDNLTMKQLVTKALGEHFQHGATTRTLIEFFRDGWGRDVGRTNLSPQLSRLFNEGKIGRVESERRWVLRPEGYLGPRRAYWRGTVGQIIYQMPSEAWQTDEPCVFVDTVNLDEED